MCLARLLQSWRKLLQLQGHHSRYVILYQTPSSIVALFCFYSQGSHVCWHHHDVTAGNLRSFQRVKWRCASVNGLPVKRKCGDLRLRVASSSEKLPNLVTTGQKSFGHPRKNSQIFKAWLSLATQAQAQAQS